MNGRLLFNVMGRMKILLDVQKRCYTKWDLRCQWNHRRHNIIKRKIIIYQLLTELDGDTVSCESSFFFPFRIINRRGENEEDDVNKIFIISLLCLAGLGRSFIQAERRLNFLRHLGSKMNQFEIVFKSLARFNTQFK